LDNTRLHRNRQLEMKEDIQYICPRHSEVGGQRPHGKGTLHDAGRNFPVSSVGLQGSLELEPTQAVDITQGQKSQHGLKTIWRHDHPTNVWGLWVFQEAG
jgi:hypothetical protein